MADDRISSWIQALQPPKEKVTGPGVARPLRKRTAGNQTFNAMWDVLRRTCWRDGGRVFHGVFAKKGGFVCSTTRPGVE